MRQSREAFGKSTVLIVVAAIGATLFALGAGTPHTGGALTPSSGWTEETPATSPPARAAAVMAYDPATQNIVLFGGNGVGGGNGSLDDTWTWNGTTWTQLRPATSPPGLGSATMAYDPTSKTLVLFGGVTPTDGTGENETWTWNGTTWTQQFPTVQPPGRYYASMAYDQETGSMVLFGGNDNAAEPLDDTWTWDGTNWTQQSPPNSPPARWGASMAYDQGTGNVVLFGGWINQGQLDDTWTWDGSDWTEQHPSDSPPGRGGAMMAYDPTVTAVVLFGGSGNYPGFGAVCQTDFCGDTWTWDGSNWVEQSSTLSPSARYVGSMDFDPSSGGVVLFGGDGAQGSLNDTWTWATSPTTAVLIPSTGGTESGTAALLDATASSGVTDVTYELSGGPSHLSDKVIATGSPTYYGWLAQWNSTTVANGSYSLQSVASYAGGVSGSSLPVSIRVKQRAHRH